MVTLSFGLDEELNAALDALCQRLGRDKQALVTAVLRQYVETERLKEALCDPALHELYRELSQEDVALAGQGLAEYEHGLREADEA